MFGDDFERNSSFVEFSDHCHCFFVFLFGNYAGEAFFLDCVLEGVDDGVAVGVDEDCISFFDGFEDVFFDCAFFFAVLLL